MKVVNEAKDFIDEKIILQEESEVMLFCGIECKYWAIIIIFIFFCWFLVILFILEH